MRVGKQFAKKDDIECLARKMRRRTGGSRIGHGGAASGGQGASTFTDLTDTPGSYSGQGLASVRANAGETALEFFDPILNDLADINAPAPADRQILTWDEGAGEWVAADAPTGSGAGATVLADLTDVEIPSGEPNDGDLLTWDLALGKWTPLPPVPGSGSGAAASEHLWIEETFDALNLGGIIGQGVYNECAAWADGGMAAGSTAEVVSDGGAGRMLRVINKAAAGATNSAIDAILSTVFGANGGGRIHFKFKMDKDTAGYGGRFTIEDSAGYQPLGIYFRYSTTFQLAVWTGANGYKIIDVSKDTWYTVDAFWGPGAGAIFQICINGAYAYRGVTGNPQTIWDRFSISSYSPAGGSDCALDVDDLYIHSLQPLIGI